MSRIVAAIVASNSMKFMPECLASLEAQAYVDVSVLVVDNGSSDGLEAYLRGNHPKAAFLRNTRQLGWAHAANQAIAFARARFMPDAGDLFILSVDPRMSLERDCVSRLMGGLQGSSSIGSAAPKIMRASLRGEGEPRAGAAATGRIGDRGPRRDLPSIVEAGEFLEHEPTDIIDSVGLRLTRWHSFRRRETGVRDQETSHGRHEEVFGVSPELALYRLSALESVAKKDEYFDEDLTATAAGHDLVWRLRLRGWSSVAVRSARAFRRAVTAAANGRQRLRAYLRKSSAVRTRERRDRLVMLAKDEHLLNILIYFPLFVFKGLAVLAGSFIVEPATLAALPQAIAALPRVFAWRRISFSSKVKSGDVRRWMA